jgi:RNA polymerase sigma factor (sigma-70 family)
MVELWERFRQQDDKAFSILFETFADTLYGYGRKFIADDDFVKDCVQDLFVKLYNNRTSLSPTTNPKFYLLFSLKNTIIDALAKTGRIIYVSPDDLPFLGTGYYIQETDSPEEAETGLKIKEALDVLNARQKEAIYLRFQQGLSYEEVSRMLGINYQSARNLIHRSITKIRSTYDVNEYEMTQV